MTDLPEPAWTHDEGLNNEVARWCIDGLLTTLNRSIYEERDKSDPDEPKPLTAEERQAEARRHFEHWSPSTTRRFELAQEGLARGYVNEAAFDLH